MMEGVLPFPHCISPPWKRSQAPKMAPPNHALKPTRTGALWLVRCPGLLAFPGRVAKLGSVRRRTHHDTKNDMGIRNRDYMKRPSDDDDERTSSPESRAEEFAQRVLARSRKLLLIGGIVLGI